MGTYGKDRIVVFAGMYEIVNEGYGKIGAKHLYDRTAPHIPLHRATWFTGTGHKIQPVKDSEVIENYYQVHPPETFRTMRHWKLDLFDGREVAWEEGGFVLRDKSFPYRKKELLHGAPHPLNPRLSIPKPTTLVFVIHGLI